MIKTVTNPGNGINNIINKRKHTNKKLINPAFRFGKVLNSCQSPIFHLDIM